MGELDITYSYIALCGTDGIALCTPRTEFLRKQATSYASEATGMQINVGRIDLRFPLNLLVRDVEVIQVPDTLLTLGSLNVHVQAMPLFKGK